MSTSIMMEAEPLGEQVGQVHSTRFLIDFFSRDITEVFLPLRIFKVIPDTCFALVVSSHMYP